MGERWSLTTAVIDRAG